MQSTFSRTATEISVVEECSEATRIGSEMKTGITSFGAWMLGVGSIIGSMAWLMHGPMIARAGVWPCICAWIIAGAMSLPLALVLMELSSMFPAAGGPYVYKYYALKKLFPRTGELFGFLTGWLFWVCLLVGLAAMANGLVNLLSSNIFGSVQASPVWFGPIAILLLFGSTTACNLLSISKASKLSNVFTIMKFAMAISFGLLVAFSGKASVNHVFANVGTSTNFVGSVCSVLMLAMAGFSCLELSGCTSSETKDAATTVPKAVFRTLITVTAMYVGMCLAVGSASLYTLAADQTTVIIPGTSVQGTCPAVAGFLGGPIWGTMFTVAVVASIVGCGFSALLANARISYSMAKTGLFPKQFACLDTGSGVPKHALWFQFWGLCIVAVAANLACRSGLFPDAYTFMGETFGFLYSFLVIMYGVCVLSLRYTDPDMSRPFRIGSKGNWLAWLIAGVVVLFWGYAAFFCVSWTHQCAGFIVMAAGIPIYAYYRRRK